VTDYTYVGGELDLFAAARRWKSYWASKVDPFVRGEVLEVGAGIGTNTLALCDASRHRWTCLEPDPSLADKLRAAIASAPLGSAAQIIVGTTRDLQAVPSFDSVLYIDVLEHIDDDREELRRASTLLRPGGHLIVLAPAHQFLYSAFDKAIGHYRRYSRRDLVRTAPPTIVVRRAMYLDAVGLAASLTNRLALRQALPTAAQIQFWDRMIVPLSRVVDPMLAFTLGKTVVAVWAKPAI
jgi:SAM-dependent methyltransferase